ncbi:MAG TPA: glycosyltransferase family 2 protein [Patescibacteria group bacterium]|nr:glycosyltransferase family 2 protein [Patescibacteria group bacterium]
MTSFFGKVFDRYPIKTRRFLEILPGFFSWTIILSPIWGSLLVPYFIAYFILFFDVYWLYKSFSLAITSYIASNKIKTAEKIDWLKNTRKFKNYKKVSHVIIIPNYTEAIYKLKETINALALQTFPTKKIFVVLAMEEREKDASVKAKELTSQFGKLFGGFLTTYHPDIEGEVKGKSSNQSYAAKVVYKDLVKRGVIDMDYTTITTADADSIFDPQYFSYLAFEFLRDNKRYHKFWQSATVYYNNFWKVPPPTRIISFFGSLWRTGVLIQKDKLISNSTYSLSFKMLKDIGFWDTDVVPEDYRIFFKAFYKLHGNVWAEPIFLRTSMDAPLSAGRINSLKNKYDQERRWSWGVSDDPLFIKWWFIVPGVPFWRKTLLLYNVLLDHFLWPANWFIITIAANIMPFVNPVFTRTSLGYNVPRLAGFILTLCLVSLASMIIIDFRNNPKHNKSMVRKILFLFEFLLLPVAGFFLSTLPAIFSHTQLMFGKRLEYKVTEKI